MTSIIRLSILAVILIGLIATGDASDNVTTLNPDPYLVSQPRQGGNDTSMPIATGSVEKSKATVGTQTAIDGSSYAIVAPTYDGKNGMLSYLRLFSAAKTPSSFSIKIVGSPSGQVYGTSNIQVLSNASPQYALSQILQNANVNALNDADTSFSLYIKNPDLMSGYQHVTYNERNGFLENVSACNSLINQAMTANASSAALTNVHTTRIASYPSQIELHNYWNAAVTYRLAVFDSRDGSVIGTVNMPTVENATYVIPFSAIESQLNWQPNASQFHVNVIVTDPSGGLPHVALGQSITNQQLQSNISMTTACAVNSITVSNLSVGAPSTPTCSAPLVTIQTGGDTSCKGGNTHTWPVGIPATDCHGWQSPDTVGREHNNSASNIQCNGDGTFSFVQYAGNLDCSGTGTLKTFRPDTCSQDIPPTLYSLPVDLTCCSAPGSAACKRGLPSTSVPGSKIYLNNKLCTQ